MHRPMFRRAINLPPAPTAATSSSPRASGRNRAQGPRDRDLISAETLASARSSTSAASPRRARPAARHRGADFGTQIALRGVGTSSLDAGVEQSVAVNIDGLQLPRARPTTPAVRHGPDRSAEGPAVAVLRQERGRRRDRDPYRRPGDEAEVIGPRQLRVRGARAPRRADRSGPLSDTFGVRVAGYYTKDDGYFFNKSAGNPPPGAIAYGAKTPRNRYNINENWFIRGTAVWKPTDDFWARLKINHGHSEGDRRRRPPGRLPRTAPRPPPRFRFSTPVSSSPIRNDDCKIDRNVYIVDLDPAAFPGIRNNGTPFTKKDFTFGSAELNYKVAAGHQHRFGNRLFKTTIDGLINGANSGYWGPTLYADNHLTGANSPRRSAWNPILGTLRSTSCSAAIIKMRGSGTNHGRRQHDSTDRFDGDRLWHTVHGPIFGGASRAGTRSRLIRFPLSDSSGGGRSRARNRPGWTLHRREAQFHRLQTPRLAESRPRRPRRS